MVASGVLGYRQVRGYAIETQEQPPLFGNRPIAELYRKRWLIEISRPHYDRNDTLYLYWFSVNGKSGVAR
jgi:hypothetical protein